ncbi:NAD-dependent epimerase/dehydratase family protein [Arcobacter sp.]|uniref:NAD-dependent epimerase/dehydratase family protein n=1 Tax=Arcobacter sp. TaxID=1872629 RepID=UPI003D0BB73F
MPGRSKVLITGGFGNLGSYITKHLATLGYDIFILTQKEKNKFQDFSYTVIECDITNLESLEKKLNIDFDYCIHMASFNEFFLPEYSRKALEINTLGTRNLLEILSKKNIKNFIYFSTFHVYGKSSGIIDENTSLEPKNDYASTHLFAEYYIKQFSYTHNLKYTILRLTNSYGAPIFNDTTKWYLVLNDLVRSAFEHNKIVIKSNGNAKRDFIWMGDVVKVVEKLIENPVTNDTFNLSANKSYKVIELAKIVQKEYANIYKKKIDIEVNNDDKTLYEDIFVQNNKLNSLIPYEATNMLSEEVVKIFKLLEKNEA